MFKPCVAALLLLMGASQALALPPVAEPAEAAEARQEKVFLGLSIPLTGDRQPRVTLGLRRVTVESDGSLQGAELRLDLNPQNLRDAQLRALALKGRVSRAGAIGGGWDFGTGRALATGGVVLPHLSGIADFGIGTSPRISIGLDTLEKFDTPVVPVAPVLVDHCGNPLGAGEPEPRC